MKTDPPASQKRSECGGKEPQETQAAPVLRKAGALTEAERLEEGETVMSRPQVEEWLDAMTETSICGLGQAAPFPVRNAFRHWPELFAPLGEARVA